MMQENAQVFIKIEDYKKIISTVNLLKSKLEEAKEILKRISELKIQEYNQLSKWDANLEEIEKRIKAVDQNLGRL